jgi:uncharacterized repeat protein (TIGR03803 family)
MTDAVQSYRSITQERITTMKHFLISLVAVVKPQIPVRLCWAGRRAAMAIFSATLLLGTVVAHRAEAQMLLTLNNFNLSDGASPHAGLVRDLLGNLYGTTVLGGSSYNGTIFKLNSSGNYTVLHNFGTAAGLILDSAGNFYGTTDSGGSAGYGTVFKLDTSGNNYTVLHNFNDGSVPRRRELAKRTPRATSTARPSVAVRRDTGPYSSSTPPAITTPCCTISVRLRMTARFHMRA